MQFFCGQQGEAVVEVETHLVAEGADGSGTCTVVLRYSVVEHMLQEVEVLFHVCPLYL